jgi:Flp pilus assembly pilin Flp
MEAPNRAAAEVAACEPMRCGFGAVRVGALLGRLRLHLQTERFLAVHRGDTMWERGCLGAALALAVMVAGMQEAELDAALSHQHTQDRRALGTAAKVLPQDEVFRCSAGLQPGISACGDVNAALKGSATSTGVKRGAR